MNADGRVNARYSTPSIYAAAKLASVALPMKNDDDYMPLIDSPGHGVWSGYFTSVRGSCEGFGAALSSADGAAAC